MLIILDQLRESSNFSNDENFHQKPHFILWKDLILSHSKLETQNLFGVIPLDHRFKDGRERGRKRKEREGTFDRPKLQIMATSIGLYANFEAPS